MTFSATPSAPAPATSGALQFQLRPRTLRTILGAAALPVLVVGTMRLFSGRALLHGISDVFLALLAAAPAAGLYLYLRHKVPPGTAAVTIDTQGIHSPLFTGSRKSFAWRDIAAAEARSVQGQLQLVLTLPMAPGEVLRKPLFGGSPARPALALNLLSEQDREAIADAVQQRIATRFVPAAADPLAANPATANPFTAERAYHDGLRALTPRPYATWALAALNIGIWLAMVAASGGKFLALPSDELFAWGGNAAYEVLHNGAWWRLLTATFLHGGLLHIAMNMLALFSLGPLAERLFGPRAYLMLYLVAGIAGSALSLCYAAQTVISVGASGALFGVAGALAATLLRHRKALPPLTAQGKGGLFLYLLYSLAQGLGHSGIDNAAHIGGLAAGCLMALLLPIRVGQAGIARAARPANGVAAALAGLGLAAALITLAPDRPWDIRALLATEARLPSLLQRFDSELQLVQREDAAAKADADVRHEWAWDTRLRDEVGPRLLALAHDMDDLSFRPHDSRAQLVEAMGRIAWRASQQAATASVPDPATGRPVPADKPAFDQLSERLKEAIAQMQKAGAEVRADAAKRKKP